MDEDRDAHASDPFAARPTAAAAGRDRPASGGRTGDRGPRAAGSARPAVELTRTELEGLPARQSASLEAFYEAYFDRIHGYVRRLVRDEHQVEDLTQDIFMNIHRALPSYDPARALRPWVFTIASNRLRDWWQSRAFQDGQRRVRIDDESLDVDPPVDPRPGPSLAVERAEEGVTVARAISALPEGLRAPFWLRWREELSFADIAAQLGLTELAARKRYSRALGELRRALGGTTQDWTGSESSSATGGGAT